jgi:hypothetical protein
LANFTAAQTESVQKAGFNVETGYVGKPQPGQTPWVPFYAPHPLYDYDVYVLNCEEIGQAPAESRDLRLDALMDRPPALRIVFTGKSSGPSLLSAGLAVQISHVNENVSNLLATSAETFAIAELHEAISRLRGDVVIPIGCYLSLSVSGTGWPLQHFPVIVNRNNDQIAAYGVNANASPVDPLYILLPQLKNNAAGLIKILHTIARIRPKILPGVRVLDWFSGSEFSFAEEASIEVAIQQRLAEAQAFVRAKKTEQAEIRKQFGFINEILVATEDPALQPDKLLTSNVRKVLEFLGFKVEDIDAKIKGAIKKEDFWVTDGEFLAITEVTGTRNKNPKSKEYNDILGRLNTIFKRSDLVPDRDKSRISGLLVVNYDIENHPAQRPQLYSGDLEHIVEAAKDSSIGLLSTVELHKIAMAVKQGSLSKESSRALLGQFGRIEYKSTKS